jgi:hypothetical protein
MTMVLHHVRMDDVAILIGIFAKLTPDGWVIPDWLVLMGNTVRV